MDRRLTPATERVAHVSLKGRVEAPAWTEGQRLQVSQALVDLLRAPGGARERQLTLGEGFVVVDRAEGHAMGFAEKDGYCGWLPEGALEDGPMPTHWVASVGTHLYEGPKVSSRNLAALPMLARVEVLGRQGKWAETSVGYVPASHLRALGDWRSDPVAVAEEYLGTPYLWGGNSRGGLDCSGLAQVVHAACGIAIPGDSDLQEAVGQEATGPHQRGDLIFWDGHVALVADEGRIIHANGFTMSVAYEGLEAAIARIAATDGPVTGRRRL